MTELMTALVAATAISMISQLPLTVMSVWWLVDRVKKVMEDAKWEREYEAQKAKWAEEDKLLEAKMDDYQKQVEDQKNQEKKAGKRKPVRVEDKGPVDAIPAAI